MRRGLRILLSGIALFSLVSCTSDESSGAETWTRYKVTFLNYDDTFLYEAMVFEGHEAFYSGKVPTKNEGESPDFHWEFTGWDPDVSCVTSNMVTRATFEYVVDQEWSPITSWYN